MCIPERQDSESGRGGRRWKKVGVGGGGEGVGVRKERAKGKRLTLERMYMFHVAHVNFNLIM